MIEFFATIELASRSALIDAYNCGEQRRECGGVIYQERRGYYYTAPVTNNRPFSVVLPEDSPPPHGSVMVADYHNHICSKRNKPFAAFFSDGDALANAVFNIVGYMLDGCTGNIMRYAPAIDDRGDVEVDLVSGKKFYLTSGHVSGWVDVYE